MERVLKAVPFKRVKMEALVHDLTLALEESSNNTSTVRRRWGLRRRARSTGNLPFLNTNKQSDDSSSSVCEIRVPKSSAGGCKYQSDSDDTNKTKRFGRFSHLHNISNIESDSVNENFIPRIVKRKRKFKRMAVDSDTNPSTSQSINFLNNTVVVQKKRFYRNNSENKYEKIYCGKRKRSCRERSIDCDMRSPKPSKSKNFKNNNEDAMDCSRISSSSLSSSDSENDINDEDREGDDEQSDWFGDSTWWDEETINDDNLINQNAFQSTIFHSNFDHLGSTLASPTAPLTTTTTTITTAATSSSSSSSSSSTTTTAVTSPTTVTINDEIRNKSYRQKIQWIREGLNGREIRAGRRHVDNKPGYSIITSANEKVSRFLQDPSQSELKLHPMRQPERDKLRRLANLYSLNLKGDLTCPVLYKTRLTTQAICVDQVSFNPFSDYKRLRRTPPNSPKLETDIMSSQEQLNNQIIHPSTNHQNPAIPSPKFYM